MKIKVGGICVRMRTRIVDMHRWTKTETIKDHVFKLADKFYNTLVFSSLPTSNLTQTRFNPDQPRKIKPLYHRLPIYLEPPKPP